MTDLKPRTDPTMVLILGIAGLMFCQLMGPVALYMGNTYRKECAALGVEPEATGTIGFVLGILGTLYFLFVMAILVLYFGFIICFGGLAVISEM